MRRAIAAAAVTLALAACGTGHTAPRCQRPALLASGAYSSYRAGGTMPSGTVVTLSDGDRWACQAGRVAVTSPKQARS